MWAKMKPARDTYIPFLAHVNKAFICQTKCNVSNIDIKNPGKINQNDVEKSMYIPKKLPS